MSNQEQPRPGVREALLDATSALTAAASAYRTYAKRYHELRPKAETDALFTTRADDFDKAALRAQKAARALAAAPAPEPATLLPTLGSST